MTETLEITTEQINDLPLLLGLVEEMGIRQRIDAQIRPHGRWQGLSVGTVVSIWLCHLLMERDHRLVVVREWAAARRQTLNALLGVQLRDTDLTDDRLANVLTMLSAPADQAAVDQALLADWLRVYALPQQRVRLDSTSVAVYQDPAPPDGLIRHGVSKEHRPDLAQFKVMLASLDPLGLPLACQAVPGNRSDDLLYVPAYDAAMQTLETTAVLVVGDSKMAALATRAHIVRGGSAYLCPYRPAHATAEIANWITQALAHPEGWHELREVDERTGEITTLAVVAEWERDQGATQTTWRERVLVTLSAQLQAGHRRKRERALAKVGEQLAALSRPPGHGRRVYRTQAELETAVADLLRTAHLEGVVWVAPQEQMRRDGTPCWTIVAFGVDLAAWRAMVDRLGWQVYLTSTTPEQYTAPVLVDAYRQQVIQERGFARLKTRNLHIRPLYLSDERRIAGLTWLLCLALRVLTLTEYRLRTALQQRGETLAGLNPAARNQTTQCPTTERVIALFQHLTRTVVALPAGVHHHVTPLTALQEQVLALLHLPADLYARLASPTPQPLTHLRE
jgi:transposase